MRPLHCLSAVPAALLLAILPLIPLIAQQDDAMKGKMQDHAAMAMGEPSAQGTLTGVNGHQASGTVHLVSSEGKYRLHFTPDFSLEKAPDVYVTLTKGPKPVQGASVVIAKLTRFAGEQAFDLPADTDPSQYSHVVLWCKKYSVAIAQAELKEAGMEKMDGMKEDKGSMMKKKDGMSKPPSKPN